MSEIKQEHSDSDIFADEEALAKDIAELKAEIARIERRKDESDWQHKLHEKVSEIPNAKQPTDVEDTDEEDFTKNSSWDFSSEFESVDVYGNESDSAENKHIVESTIRKPSDEIPPEPDSSFDDPYRNALYEVNDDDEIVQLPPESEELLTPELLEEQEIVQAPRQVSPPSVERLTDSEIERKKLQAAPKKVVVRKKNDAAIIKEFGLGEGQRALREAKEEQNQKTYVIQMSKPDSPKTRKRLLKCLADLHFDSVNIAKVEIDFQSTRPYLFIGKSLTRRQVHAIMTIMRNLKIPASVKIEKN